MQETHEAVTVAITHHVKPGREGDFDAWLRGIGRVASGFDGYQGYVVIPQATESSDRQVALRFDSLQRLNAYWESDESQAWRSKLDDIVSEPSDIHPEVGIEHWCMPSSSARPPSRHRMSVAVFLAILPLVTFVPPRVSPWLAQYVPSWLAAAMTTALLVVLMSYVAMPLVTRLLRSWLQPSPDAPRG